MEALLSMGFDEKDAAIALYRTWEDPDAAAQLLLGSAEAKDSEAGKEQTA